MLTRRIIPCLDVRHGRVVKGVRFARLRDVGDPVELARRYVEDGADELCLLDVHATVDGVGILLETVRRVARETSIPLTVGGGIRTARDARDALRAGADKVALNTAALLDPSLLTDLAEAFGRQCVVLSIDTKRTPSGWRVTTHGGRNETPRDCLEWAEEGVELGAGEILLNAIDADGTRDGFQLELILQSACAFAAETLLLQVRRRLVQLQLMMAGWP